MSQSQRERSQTSNNVMRLNETLRQVQEIAQNPHINHEDSDRIEELWRTLGNRLESCTVKETVVDLDIIHVSESHLTKQWKNICLPSPFTQSDYARKIKEKIDNWTEFSHVCAKIINRAPGISQLLNTFPITAEDVVSQKQRKTPFRRQKDVITSSQSADTLMTVKTDEQSVDLKIQQISKILKRINSPIQFYKLILHPEFCKTVENVFHMSFLIRDERASLSIVNEELMVQYVPPSGLSENVSQGQKNQMVFSIDPQDWKRLLMEYQIDEPMIP